MRKSIQDIANWLNIEAGEHGEKIVTGVSIDTRTIKEGDLFIPFRGKKRMDINMCFKLLKKEQVVPFG